MADDRKGGHEGLLGDVPGFAQSTSAFFLKTIHFYVLNFLIRFPSGKQLLNQKFAKFLD